MTQMFRVIISNRHWPGEPDTPENSLAEVDCRKGLDVGARRTWFETRFAWLITS